VRGHVVRGDAVRGTLCGAGDAGGPDSERVGATGTGLSERGCRLRGYSAAQAPYLMPGTSPFTHHLAV